MNDAKITENGAVLLGRNLTCDAHYDRPVRIITHAHSDHLLHLSRSVRYCKRIVTTPITRDLIGVLKGKKVADHIMPLHYDTPYEYERERIILYPAHHIVGSAQVLVENSEGKRILYTGDFRYPPAQVIKTDILVMEATYGNPSYVRSFKEEVEQELVELVKKSLKESSVYIFGYHGKLQEVVKILNASDIDTPLVVPEKVFEALKVCQSHGIDVKNFYLSKSDIGLEIQKSPHIGIYHMVTSKWVGKDAVKILLSGWQFDVPCKMIRENTYQVALSDHSDFNQLIEYCSQINPRLIITDNYRAGDAPVLTQEIKSRLGIDAISMPY